MKKLLCGIIPLVLVLVLCTGCGSMERVDYQAVLLDYLSNRYPDDTFTVDSNQIGTERNTVDSFSVYFRSESIPGAPIVAWRKKVDGQYTFKDNYMKYYLKADMEEYVHNIAEKYFGECKVYMHFGEYRLCLPESFPTDATAEDFLKTGQDCSFVVFISPGHITLEDAREEFKTFKSAFEKRNFDNVGMGAYILPDTESFKKTDSFYGPNGVFNDREKFDYVGGFSDI